MTIPTPDIRTGVNNADVVAFGRHAEAVPVVKGPNMVWAEKLGEMKQKADAADIFRQIAEADNKPKYDARNAQQDIARFGGGAARLDASGKAILEPGATTAQAERFEKGKDAIDRVSSVSFWMDILKLPDTPPNVRQDAINDLRAKNPSFRELGATTVTDLETLATTAMFEDPNVVRIIDSLPLPGTGNYTQAEKIAIIKKMILTDGEFGEKLAQNVHQIHERLLQLKQANPGESAALQRQLSQQEQIVADRSKTLTERLKRLNDGDINPLVTGANAEADVKALIESSADSADFQKKLIVKLGKVTEPHYDQVVQYIDLQKKIDAATTRKNLIPTSEISRTKAAQDEIEALTRQLDVVKTTHGGTQAEIDAEVSTIKKFTTLLDRTEVRSDIQEGTRASIESMNVRAKITTMGTGSQETASDMNSRLDAEKVIIQELQKVLGTTLAEVYMQRKDQMQILKDQAVQEAIAKAGSQAEKDLILGIETGYVAYDAQERAQVIKGDRIVEGAKLLSMGDRGLRVLMVRDMHMAEPSGTSTLFDAIFSTNDPVQQQEAITRYLDAATSNPAMKEVLDKAVKDHGSEYRLKVMEGYYTMQDYLKEGFMGHALRIGRHVRYEGNLREMGDFFSNLDSWKELLTGDGPRRLNAVELQNLYKYCGQDVEQAIKNNKQAHTFFNKMVREGQINDPEALKRLLWWLFVILGGGTAAIATGGAAIPAGLGVLGGGLAGGATNKFVSP